MRADRLVSILSLLQTYGRLTAHQLAERLEVSVRTIYRDMESLSGNGIPIQAEAGHDGGYRLAGGYRTRLTGFSSAEAEALFLTGLPDAAADLGLGDQVATARRKLLAALPDALRGPARQLTELFHLDPATWYQDADDVPLLRVVSDATWHRRRIRIRYLRWHRPHRIERIVNPYGLVFKAGAWYLVAASADRVRTYRVSRILTAEPDGAHFERPADFDLARYWRGWLTDFAERRFRCRATVRFSPDALRDLAHQLDSAVCAAIESSRSAPDRAGWVTADVPIESISHAVGQLLRFGADVEVLAPARLRAAMTDAVEALHDRYR